MIKEKTIEEKYQKLSQREHVLKRSGMYIGDIKKNNEELWVMGSDNKMIKKFVEYSPGFMKIFDEVLSNATDHAIRDPTVTTIKVDYNKDTGEISVYNNGTGVPVVMHKEQNIYVPELIFGHLLSGSNYDDSDSKIVVGTNGMGVKVVNIFSTKFNIETVDSENKKKYIQEFSNNMENKTVPKVTTAANTKSYTKITFTPDYKRFSMTSLEDDAILLMKKRVYDCIANVKNVSLYINGEKLKGKSFTDYIKYYFEDSKVIYESNIQTIKGIEFIWEYAVVSNDKFEQVSFVNGNCTNLGGKHLDYILYQIINKLKDQLESKKKLKDIKPGFIKDKMFIFLKSTIINPTFNSQTKETLTTQVKEFGCKVDVTDSFMMKLYKSSMIDEIVQFCRLKESANLSKTTDGRKVNKVYIPKLEDAIYAGTIKSNQCTLILTEGDSAKTFAMWGRGSISGGPEKYGIYPLKGKCVSEDIKIPLFNGEIKLAKDIQIGDILIGDDGHKRTVLTLYKGNGKMYEVFQDRGESYKVNDEHILTLCIPEHKTIYWIPSNYTWRTIYWDKITKNIKAKEIGTLIKVQCKECKIMINTKCLKKHYARKHKNVEYIPYKLEDKDMNDTTIIEARKKLDDFLLNIDDNNIIDISIEDYFKVTKSFQRKLKGIRGECVKWDHQDVLLDPYVLGLWLGDGCKSGYSYACDGENDYQIIDYLKEWCLENDANIKLIGKFRYGFSSIENFRKMGEAPLKKILEKYNVIKNKHIPKKYIINSKEIRLKVLAGIIDSDGTVYDDGTIEISQSVQVHQQLADDIVYLSRSLGFYTHIKKKVTNYIYKTGEKAEAYIIKISGYTEEIPTILPRKKSRSTMQYNMRNSTGTIKIKAIDNYNYVGIGLDCNSRFVINDFTVTHNCLNVRDASISQLINNEEINNIKQIVGLKENKVYTDTKELRYGRIMLLTDADHDGSHIKSLIVNFIHNGWESLLKISPNFIQTLKTPIVKAIKGKDVKEFFTEQDYNLWVQNSNIKNYKINYYKGLGTSTKDDAKQLFKRFDELVVNYYYKDNKCDESILLAFDKDKNNKIKKIKDTDTETSDIQVKCTDLRKAWLAKYDKNLYIDVKENKVSYQDLINKELIHFSIYDNSRSIPSLCDGLKPSQRKILYYMLKNNVCTSVKVAQLSGKISSDTSYHHGEASLEGAIVGLAQNFVGTNNINLLYPDGNFGSRLQGGKDSASSRYIKTRLSDITPLIFNKLDTPLLEILKDDGVEIEPEWYLPIIPMILVNGCEGIGTGYSTNIPPYNPKDLVNNILRILQNKEPLEMIPYYKNFNGELIKDTTKENSYLTKGKWEQLSDTQIKVTELPVGCWVTTYKEFLESLIESNKKDTKNKKKFVLKCVENRTKDENSQICFLIEFKDAKDLDLLIKSKTLLKELKLTKSVNTNNMHVFSESLILTKYNNPNDILLDWFDLRLEYYQKRKDYLINKYTQELIIMEAKIRFIKAYIDKELDINRKSKEYIVNLLEKEKYPKDHSDSFDYLLNQSLYALTEERIQSLETQVENKNKELDYISSKSDKELWCVDLEELNKYL